MSPEYWRWTEYRWRNPDLDWRKARVVTAGVDVGSVSSQAAIICDGELYAYSNIRTGADSLESARRAMELALEATEGMKVEDLQYIVGTGYGRVNVPFAHRAVTEITCHARGAIYLFGPTVRTVLDIGGQDCKAIRCDEKGRVTAFVMNDKCAAGTGRGMEIICDLLAVPVTEAGELSLSVDEEPQPVSSTCVLFAKSEAVSLLRQGWPRNKVLAAYCGAMVRRVVGLLNRVGVEKDLAITGGIAKNPGIVRRVERALGLQALTPRYDAQITGAVGAGLLAQGWAQKAERPGSVKSSGRRTTSFSCPSGSPGVY
ncbi:MAG: benzoyl-CoA reductase, bzd-type, subunit Q [Moorellales bacterium]